MCTYVVLWHSYSHYKWTGFHSWPAREKDFPYCMADALAGLLQQALPVSVFTFKTPGPISLRDWTSLHSYRFKDPNCPWIQLLIRILPQSLYQHDLPRRRNRIKCLTANAHFLLDPPVMLLHISKIRQWVHCWWSLISGWTPCLTGCLHTDRFKTKWV